MAAATGPGVGAGARSWGQDPAHPLCLAAPGKEPGSVHPTLPRPVPLCCHCLPASAGTRMGSWLSQLRQAVAGAVPCSVTVKVPGLSKRCQLFSFSLCNCVNGGKKAMGSSLVSNRDMGGSDTSPPTATP